MPKVIPQYKEQAKERIVKAAKQVFSEKGYHEARMEDIADRLGVSKRTLYLYYENKEELFKAIAAEAPEQVRKMLRACFESSGFEEACINLFDIATKEPVTGLDFEIIATASRNLALRKIMLELSEREVGVVSEVLQELKTEGDFPRDLDALSLARALLALFEGLMADLVIGVKKSDVRQAWVKSIKLIMQNLSGERPRAKGSSK